METQLFDWINQYVFPIVMAVILLVYTLYQQATTQRRMAEAMDRVGETLAKVAADLTALAATQARQSDVLSEVVRTLDRLQARMERDG